MAEWFARYQTATGRLLGIDTAPTPSLPGDQSEVSMGDFATGNPWSNGKMWDESTRTVVDRPPKVIRSRVGYDIQNNPYNWPEIDDYNAAVDAVNSGPRRAAIRAAVRAMTRRFLGIDRFRGDDEPGEIAPDDGGPD